MTCWMRTLNRRMTRHKRPAQQVQRIRSFRRCETSGGLYERCTTGSNVPEPGATSKEMISADSSASA